MVDNDTLILNEDTVERVDEIVAAQFDGDTTKREAAVNRALDVYEPFTKKRVNTTLKRISQVLVSMDELEEATEANIVSYALRGMLAHFADISRAAEKNRT